MFSGCKNYRQVWSSNLGILLIFLPPLQEMHGINTVIIRGPTSRLISIKFRTRGPDIILSYEFDHAFAG